MNDEIFQGLDDMVANLFGVMDFIFLDDTMKIHLPYPVSVNAMYRNVRGKGRVKTRKYSDWIFVACLKHGSRDIERVPGKICIHIEVKRPDKRKRDIDNLAKGVLDFLTLQQIIDDDRNVEKVIIEWVYDGPEGATVTIEKM